MSPPEIAATALLATAALVAGIGMGAAWVTGRFAARVRHLENRTMRLIDADCDTGRRLIDLADRVDMLARDTVRLDNTRRRKGNKP